MKKSKNTEFTIGGNPLHNLSKPQKIFLGCIGLIITSFQLYKFSEDGVEGSGWILSFVAAALFILPSISLFSNSASKKYENPPANNAATIHSTLFSETFTRGKALHNHLQNWLALPEVPGFEEMRKLTVDSWLQYCLTYMFALVCLAEFKKKSNFLDSDAYKSLFVKMVYKLSSLLQESAKSLDLEEKMNEEAAKKIAVRDLMEARSATLSFINAILSDSKEPDQGLLSYMTQKIGVNEDMQKTFLPQLKAFTKQTLSELTQQKI